MSAWTSSLASRWGILIFRNVSSVLSEPGVGKSMARRRNYSGVWCPYCNYELTALEAARKEIESRGASLVAISQQLAPNSRKSQRQNGLGFPILGDHSGEAPPRY